jgi:hypothetical protein
MLLLFFKKYFRSPPSKQSDLRIPEKKGPVIFINRERARFYGIGSNLYLTSILPSRTLIWTSP